MVKNNIIHTPTPATIFSLFYDGKFITTDLSVYMDSRGAAHRELKIQKSK
ncbi:YoaP domain-containing protein [Roseimarinus sediminis]